MSPLLLSVAPSQEAAAIDPARELELVGRAFGVAAVHLERAACGQVSTGEALVLAETLRDLSGCRLRVRALEQHLAASEASAALLAALG